MESSGSGRDTAWAMSKQNVELVRRVFEVFNQGGPAAVNEAELLSDDLEFDATGANLPGIGVIRGQDSVTRFFEEDWFAAFPFAEWEIEIEEPISNGDQVIVTSRQKGRGASSGVATALELGNVLTIHNGKITRMQIYRPADEAFKAAGVVD